MKKYNLIWRKNIFEIVYEDDTTAMYPCIFKDIIFVGTDSGYIYIFDIYDNIKDRYAIRNNRCSVYRCLVYPYLQNEQLYFVTIEYNTPDVIGFYKFLL